MREFYGYYWQSHNLPNDKEPFEHRDNIALGQKRDGVYWTPSSINDKIGCVAVYRELNTVTNQYDYHLEKIDIKFLSFSIQDSDNVMTDDKLKEFLNLTKEDVYYKMYFDSSLVFDIYTYTDMLDNNLNNVPHVPLIESRGNNHYSDMTSYYPLMTKNVTLYLTFQTSNNESTQTYRCTVRGDWSTDRNYLRDFNYMTGKRN